MGAPSAPAAGAAASSPSSPTPRSPARCSPASASPPSPSPSHPRAHRHNPTSPGTTPRRSPPVRPGVVCPPQSERGRACTRVIEPGAPHPRRAAAPRKTTVAKPRLNFLAAGGCFALGVKVCTISGSSGAFGAAPAGACLGATGGAAEPTAGAGTDGDGSATAGCAAGSAGRGAGAGAGSSSVVIAILRATRPTSSSTPAITASHAGRRMARP